MADKDRLAAIQLTVNKAHIPYPKRGNCKPRPVDPEYAEFLIGRECSRWQEQLDRFCQEFQKRYTEDKTFRDIRVPAEYVPIDTDLCHALRIRMKQLGYTQIFAHCSIRTTATTGRITHYQFC
jgi:hypothetical protein